MKATFLIICLAALISSIYAFNPTRSTMKASRGLSRASLVSRGSSRLNGAAEGKEYWEGDWVCADCGYIYDADIDDPKGLGRPFEEMVRGFICPQCSAPRKRYAKAVNGQWGVTNDGGDLPIYAATVLGLALTTWFALVYVPTL